MGIVYFAVSAGLTSIDGVQSKPFILNKTQRLFVLGEEAVVRIRQQDACPTAGTLRTHRIATARELKMSHAAAQRAGGNNKCLYAGAKYFLESTVELTLREVR
jgi:hypothetical protein